MKSKKYFLLVLPIIAVFSLIAASCGDDDGGSVRNLDSSESSSGSGSGSGSASGSASGSSSASAVASASASASGSGSASMAAGGSTADATPADGGYAYASNIDSHRLVVEDICEINEIVGDYRWSEIAEIYANGSNSVKSDGSVRTIGGFAAGEGKKHGVDTYYGTPTPLDDFVSAALNGTGVWAGESDAVRKQGVQKGIMNQVMIAWVVHELNAALAKAADGNFDAATGAPHNWDEAWAFYHGSAPGCGPFATANKRAKDFGTLGSDGETALANEGLLAAMIDGRDALLAGDEAGAISATNEAVKHVFITYAQATIKYAAKVYSDLEAGDTEAARVHQAEGWAFFRIIEPILGNNGIDTSVIDSILNMENDPGSGSVADIQAVLDPVITSFGITPAEFGSYG
ncbi:MAG: FEA1-related lipoprotein [Actinomycetota bacterium]|nr:FEA1-related lipoprotein [Actinomycetota bacterium]